MTAYATKANAFYNQTASNFINLQQRLKDSLSDFFDFQLESALAEFKRKHPKLKKFKDMNLCNAIMVSMDKILIDTTMQRQLNFPHVVKILKNFTETMVMAIQVYEDPQKPGYFIAWDGQHTAIALYILVTKLFGEKVADIMVPVVVYPVKMKAEIRRNFILLNGDAKEPLKHIDIFRQMVCGVRIDGATDPVWVQAELKQQYLEKAGLFATHDTFNDETEPGALTLLANTIMSDSEKTLKNPEVTRMFAEYWMSIGQERPVEAKEARQLFEFFNYCFEQDIKVDKAYIVAFAQFTTNNFQADFSPGGVFWSKVKTAYRNWYDTVTPASQKEYNASGDLIVRGYTEEWRVGGPFIIAQVKKSTKLKVPKYDANNGFVPAKADLW
jgi:hypothetical protein